MAQSENQYCTACGHELSLTALFCTDCGHEVGAAPSIADAPLYQPNTLGSGCAVCAGDGSLLPMEYIYCPSCRWLRPLADSYFVDVEAFIWDIDAQAMAALNNSGPIASAAHGIAERYGRPVFEAATNGIRLSERQMPEIFDIAVRAARLLSLPRLPEVYISGERMWDVYSLGGYGGSFVSIGSVLINFKPKELLFLIAREMGHVRAGHAFWSTAMQFVMGQNRARGTILGEGVMQFLNPAKLVESAVEAPLMRWARQSQITADRAATLVTGDIDTARVVLTQWAMKSFPVAGKLNLEAWLEQEAAADDPYLRLSEWTMSTEPYLAPRLKVLSDFVETEAFREWHRYIDYYSEQAGLPNLNSENKPKARKPKAPPPNTQRITCAACGEGMRVPSALLEGDKPISVRCPSESCRKVLRVKPKQPIPEEPKPMAQPATGRVRIQCAACKEAMMVKRSDLTGGAPVNVRCPNSECGEILSIKPKKKTDEQALKPDLTSD